MEFNVETTLMTDFLNLPQLKTLAFKEHDDHYLVLAEGGIAPTGCDACTGGFYRHGSQCQTYLDTPMHGKKVLIEIDRRRLRCKRCGKTVSESLPCIDGKRLATKRLIEYVERRCLRQTFVSLAREVGLDEKTVRFIFDDYVARKQVEAGFRVPEILGVDELKIVGSYRVTLTNIDKLALFDLLQSRKKVSLLEYFDRLDDKHNVRVLVMDLWSVYRQVGQQAFPGRMIVADRFHVVRMANDALERVRKRLRKTLSTRERLRLKDDRFVLLTRADRLTAEQAERAQSWFRTFPALGKAYYAKEAFFDIYNHSTRAAAEDAAEQWSSMLAPEIAQDFREVRVALASWWREIFNFYEYPVTNAYTESINGLAKFIQRMGRGYSFEVIRARLLYNEAAMKNARTTIRRRIRRERAPDTAIGWSTGMFGRDVAEFTEEHTNHGAHIPTLIQLLEQGEFS